MLTHSVDKDSGWVPSLPLPKKWHRAALCFSASRRGQLLWVFHPPGRSTDGVFPVGSPYQRLSLASCHLKVSADSGVELSVSWSHGQTRGIIEVQLQTAGSAHVYHCEGCRSWYSSKVTLFCLFPMLGHWLQQLTWPDRAEGGRLVILQDGLEGRGGWRNAATVTSSLL